MVVTPVLDRLLYGVRTTWTAVAGLRLLYLALVAGVAAVALQAWAQRHLPATQAAVILVTEPVWATGLAVTLTAETLPPQLLLGGGVLLVANLVVALASRPRAGVTAV